MSGGLRHGPLHLPQQQVPWYPTSATEAGSWMTQLTEIPRQNHCSQLHCFSRLTSCMLGLLRGCGSLLRHVSSQADVAEQGGWMCYWSKAGVISLTLIPAEPEMMCTQVGYVLQGGGAGGAGGYGGAPAPGGPMRSGGRGGGYSGRSSGGGRGRGRGGFGGRRFQPY